MGTPVVPEPYSDMLRPAAVAVLEARGRQFILPTRAQRPGPFAVYIATEIEQTLPKEKQHDLQPNNACDYTFLQDKLSDQEVR
jgi:hypothetical protein